MRLIALCTVSIDLKQVAPGEVFDGPAYLIEAGAAKAAEEEKKKADAAKAAEEEKKK